MSTVDVLDAAGAPSGSVDLPAEIFDTQVNIALIHQVVVGQLAAARQGTHDTLNRGEVSGGGRKPYRQKGTGRARQGSIRAPQFTGGGVVHGPTPRGYEQRTPKKMKAAALRGALSDRARDGRVHVVESFVEGDRPSTKAAAALISKVSERPRALVVVERGDELTLLSLRNLQRIHVLVVDQLNTYDVLASDDVIFTKGAFDTLVGERSGDGPRQMAAAEPKPVVVEAEQPKPVVVEAEQPKPVVVEAGEPVDVDQAEAAAEVDADPEVEVPGPAAETDQALEADEDDTDGVATDEVDDENDDDENDDDENDDDEEEAP